MNLLGEHTDYTGGLVLPIAIPFYTQAQIALLPAVDRPKYRFTSANFSTGHELELGQRTSAAETWSDYPIGVLRQLEALGLSLPPFHLHLNGDIPLGAGLSSSASVEVASALAMLSLRDAELSAKELALLCQRAENEYVHSPCGIMDQFAIVAARRSHAILLDTDSFAVEHIPLAEGKLADTVFLVCNCMVKHSISSGEYGRRRDEVEAGQAAVTARFPSVRRLGEAQLAHLNACSDAMPTNSLLRCRHIVTENARVRAAVASMRSGDATLFGELMLESHASQRDFFECSCPEIDFLVETARQLPGCFGARLTGGGFGGCTVNLIERTAVDRFTDALRVAYRKRFDLEASTYVCQAVDGALSTYTRAAVTA